VVAWRDNFVASLKTARDGGRKPRRSRIAAPRREG